MRPHQPRKLVEGLSRAKSIIRRDLAWIKGFPIKGLACWCVWVEGGKSETIVVDSDRLRRAYRALSTLLRDFSRALPQLVGDLESWATELRRSLDLVKGHLGGEQHCDLLAEASEESAESAESEAWLQRTLTWRGEHCERRWNHEAKRWLESRGRLAVDIRRRIKASGVEGLGDQSWLIVCHRLFDLHVSHGAEVVDPVMRVLASDVAWWGPWEKDWRWNYQGSVCRSSSRKSESRLCSRLTRKRTNR